MAQKKKSKTKKWARPLLLLAFTAILYGAYLFWVPNTGSFAQGEYLYIRTGASYVEVKEELHRNGFVRDMKSFDLLSRNVNYPNKVRAGRYKITKGMNNYELVRLLRSGRQSPVKLVLKKLRTKKDFLQLVAKNLESDTATLAYMLADNNYLAQYGLDSNTAMCAIMPNTYEFFWNSSAEKVFEKIAKEYVVFWTAARKAKAAALGLSPQQVITIAAIVEEETNKNDEKPLVASVYINRYKIGMKLQADPTARYAYGDFMIKRITGVQTSLEHPYNTYKRVGLPPGPICTPSAKSIDAVLQSPSNKLLYFCAKEDFSGYHNFASTLAEHNTNARKYHLALDARGIK